MNLSVEDKEILAGFGYAEGDFSRIEEAMEEGNTTYELSGDPISRAEAIEELGWYVYLGAIAQSAFNSSSVRNVDDYYSIHFDSSAMQ